MIEATSPEEVFALCDADETWDLVLTDIVMPVMSGHELVRRLRDRRKETRVLYMSGYSDSAERIVDPFDAPFLQKPFSPDELDAGVCAALNAPS